MKTLFIIYHEDFEPEIRNILEREMVVPRYTRFDSIAGARMVQQQADTGYMTDRTNHIIMVISEDEVVAGLVGELKALRSRRGHGLRGFVVDAEVAF